MAEAKGDNDNEIDNQPCKDNPRTEYSVKRREHFLEELAASSNVTASAKKAGLTTSTVYYWRDHDAEFSAAWLKALATGYDLLEMEMLKRARGGVEKKVFHAGQCIDTVREYNDAMAFRLLMAHKEMIAMIRAAQAEIQISASDVRERLDRKLNDMRERLHKRRALENKAADEQPPSNGG